MKIVFFTEMKFNGKVPRTYPNMRTEFAWMVSLNAHHYHYMNIPDENYDLGIVIIPKNPSNHFSLDRLRNCCDKVAVMQEGPFWLYQDYPLKNQIHYYNNLVQSDIIFVHNEQDRKYYKGLTNHKDVRVLQSLIISDTIGELPTVDRRGIMIGGNMVSWYGGFDSFMLASSVTSEIYSPQMGRRQEGESELGIRQLPYLQWNDWIKELNKRKLGIHMMRTHAAGTFAMNTAFLSIPCIGYRELDTQRILHPNLAVDNGDMVTARKLVHRLWHDDEFYTQCALECRENYELYYSEKVWIDKFYSEFS